MGVPSSGHMQRVHAPVRAEPLRNYVNKYNNVLKIHIIIIKILLK